MFKFSSNPRISSTLLGAAWGKCWLSQDQNGKVAKSVSAQTLTWLSSFSGDLNCRLLLLIRTSSNWKRTMGVRYSCASETLKSMRFSPGDCKPVGLQLSGEQRGGGYTVHCLSNSPKEQSGTLSFFCWVLIIFEALFISAYWHPSHSLGLSCIGRSQEHWQAWCQGDFKSIILDKFWSGDFSSESMLTRWSSSTRQGLP